MNWLKVGEKGLLGILTFVVAYLASNPSMITNLIPENIANLTIGAVIAGGLVALSNWLKNRNKTVVK